MSSYRYHCISKQHIKTLKDIELKKYKISESSNISLNKANLHVEFKCDLCDKLFYNTGNVNRHKKTCKLRINNQNTTQQNVPVNTDETIKSNYNTQNGVNNITINIQQNITNNTSNIVNIELTPEEIYNNFWQQANIRPMGFEDLSGLDSQHIADIIHSFGYNCFVEFINQVYKNDVNHNIALYNKRDKMVKYVHKSGEIKIDTLVSVMSSVMMNFVDYLDTYLEKQDIEIKPQYLPVIKKLKEIHACEENTLLDKYKRHLYSRLLNITNSSLKKMEQYDNKLKTELSDSVKELALYIPSTNSRTEPDLTT
jgi:hypothetical protein